MNKTALKFFAIGVAFSVVGLIFLLSPRQIIYCTEVGEVVIAMLAVLISLQLVNLYLNAKALKKKDKKNKKLSFPKRKFLTILSVIAALLLVVFGLNEKAKRSQVFISTFSEMVSSTDKALLEFSEIDEKYLRGEETKENYEEAWYDLNFKLEQIKKQDDKLRNPPKELEELISLYRSGFYRVLSVTNDVVDYLSGEAEDPVIIIENRETFEEGLRLLRKVKDRLQSAEKII